MDKSGMVSPDFESSMKLRKEACVRYGVKIPANGSLIDASAFIDGMVKTAFLKLADEEANETQEEANESEKGETEKEKEETTEDEKAEEDKKDEDSKEEKDKEEEPKEEKSKKEEKDVAKEALLTLMTLDKEAGIEYLYDREIVDPVMTIFGSLNNPEYDAVKIAGDATQYDLIRTSRDHEKLSSIQNKLGEKFASSFRADPIRSISKLGSIEIEILSGIARS
jgi:flagellar biosynthesis GTPase FlhF